MIKWCHHYFRMNQFNWAVRCRAGRPSCDLMHSHQNSFQTYIHKETRQTRQLPLLHTLVFFIAAFFRRSSAVLKSFQIPHSRSYRPVPAARLVFMPSSAPPWYRGDAAVTCQFHGVDAHWLVYAAQNRTVGEFQQNWESPQHVFDRKQLSRIISQLHAIAGFVCPDLLSWGVPAGTLGQIILVRLLVLCSFCASVHPDLIRLFFFLFLSQNGWPRQNKPSQRGHHFLFSCNQGWFDIGMQCMNVH